MYIVQGVPKNALSECCWSHSTLAQSPFASTPCVWRSIFWSFLSKTKQDQAPPKLMKKKCTQMIIIPKMKRIKSNQGVHQLIHFFPASIELHFAIFLQRRLLVSLDPNPLIGNIFWRQIFLQYFCRGEFWFHLTQIRWSGIFSLGTLKHTFEKECLPPL